MKIQLLLNFILIVLGHVGMYCQVAPNTDFEILDINNVRSKFFNSAQLIHTELDTRDTYRIIDNNNSLYCLHSTTVMITSQGSSGNKASAYDGDIHYDFMPGPFDTTYNLPQYFFEVSKINKWEVIEFIEKFGDSTYIIPQNILEYPAHHPITLESYYPFRDVDNDGVYNPVNGDYPEYNLDDSVSCIDDYLKGDQNILWIVTDRYLNITQNPHPVNITICYNAFAFKTDTDGSGIDKTLSNASFIEMKLINSDYQDLDSVIVTLYTDGDIGFQDNDYTGTDVQREMIYFQDATLNDAGGNNTIGVDPPAIGMDLLHTPDAIANNDIDDDKDGIIDENNEQAGLRYSTFATRMDQDPLNPDYTTHFGDSLHKHIYRANGLSFTGDVPYFYDNGNAIGPYWYHLPKDSDTLYYFNNNGNPYPANHSMQDFGYPGADYRTIYGTGKFQIPAHSSVNLIIGIPYARALNQTSVGDNLPLLKEASDILQTLNDNCYQLPCGNLPEDFLIIQQSDSIFKFVYQAEAESYSWSFGNGDTSSMAFPVQEYNAPGSYQVCLTVMNDCDTTTICKSLEVSTNILNLHAVDITQLEGKGNGGNLLKITHGSIEDHLFAVDSSRIVQPVYEGNNAPIKVEIVDVNQVNSGEYAIKFDGIEAASNWKMYEIGGTDTVYSTQSIGSGARQVIPQWGVAVSVPFNYEYQFNTDIFVKDSLVHSSLEFKHPWYTWLGGVEDTEDYQLTNWLLAGGADVDCNVYPYLCQFNDGFSDEGETYENILNGSLAPTAICRKKDSSVFEDDFIYASNKINEISSIKLVYTKNKSRWTRAPVLESGLNALANNYLSIKSNPSVDKLGNADGSGTGMSWFPGYAIDLETGERLNIAFAEASNLPNENGADMMFNPTSTEMDSLNNPIWGGRHFVFVFRNERAESTSSSAPYRCPHYDKGSWLKSRFDIGDNVALNHIWRSCAYVQVPLTNPGETFLYNDAEININVSKPFRNYTYLKPTLLNNGNPMYTFSLYSNIGIEEQKSFASEAYPNPAHDQLTIKTNHTGKLNLIIYDLQGKVISERKGVKENTLLNVSNWSSGIYFYYLYSDKAEFLSKGKFIVD